MSHVSVYVQSAAVLTPDISYMVCSYLQTHKQILVKIMKKKSSRAANRNTSIIKYRRQNKWTSKE